MGSGASRPPAATQGSKGSGSQLGSSNQGKSWSSSNQGSSGSLNNVNTGLQGADDKSFRSPVEGSRNMAGRSEQKSPLRPRGSDPAVTPIKTSARTPAGTSSSLEAAKPRTRSELSFDSDLSNALRSPNYQRVILSPDMDKTSRSPKLPPFEGGDKYPSRRPVQREMAHGSRDMTDSGELSSGRVQKGGGKANSMANTKRVAAMGRTRGGGEEDGAEEAVGEGRRHSGNRGSISWENGDGARPRTSSLVKEDGSRRSSGNSGAEGAGLSDSMRSRASSSSPRPGLSSHQHSDSADEAAARRRGVGMQGTHRSQTSDDATLIDQLSTSMRLRAEAERSGGINAGVMVGGPVISPMQGPRHVRQASGRGMPPSGPGKGRGMAIKSPQTPGSERRLSPGVNAVDLAMGGGGGGAPTAAALAAAARKGRLVNRAVSSDDSCDDPLQASNGPAGSGVGRGAATPGGRGRGAGAEGPPQRPASPLDNSRGPVAPRNSAYVQQCKAFLNDDDDDDSSDGEAGGAAKRARPKDDVDDWLGVEAQGEGKPTHKPTGPAPKRVVDRQAEARKSMADFLDADDDSSDDGGEAVSYGMEGGDGTGTLLPSGPGAAGNATRPSAMAVTNGDDDSDDENVEDGDDGAVYDWCAFDTLGGGNAAKPAPPSAIKPSAIISPSSMREAAFRSESQSFLSSDDEGDDDKPPPKQPPTGPTAQSKHAKGGAKGEPDDDDDDDGSDEGGGETVYDWCAMDTSDGLTERPSRLPSTKPKPSAPSPLEVPRVSPPNTSGLPYSVNRPPGLTVMGPGGVVPITTPMNAGRGGMPRGAPPPPGASPKAGGNGWEGGMGGVLGADGKPRLVPPSPLATGLGTTPMLGKGPTTPMAMGTLGGGGPMGAKPQGGTVIMATAGGALGGFKPVPGVQGPRPPARPPALSIGGGLGMSSIASPSPAGTRPGVTPLVTPPPSVGSPSPGPLTGSSPAASPSKMSGMARGLMTPKGPITPGSAGPPSAGGDTTTPTVKDTHEVTRKKASLPTTFSHEKPTTGNWLKSRYIVNNYILLDLLGTGSYAEVRLCKDKTTNKLYAIKIIKKENMKKGVSSKYYDDVKAEIAIMKKLTHPNVLRLYEVMDDPKVNKLYLVLEYMRRGDLMHVLRGEHSTNTCQALGDLEVWRIFRLVARGVQYLHQQNIVHGDIKPQNLLVGDDGCVKIADFGISKILHGSNQKLLDTAGTPAFMSPELCSGETYSGQLADVWALGATMYMIRTGRPPFVANTVLQLYYKIQNEPLTWPPMAMDPGLRRLLEGMLVKDPSQRMTLQDVIDDPWLRFEPGGSTTIAADAMDGGARYDQITVSNDEIYKSIQQLKGKQATHAETSFEPVDEASEQDGDHSPVASSASAVAGTQQPSPVQPQATAQPPMSTKHLRKDSAGPSPPQSAPASRSSSLVPAGPPPQPPSTAAATQTKEEKQMSMKEESRRAAAFSKRISGRKKSVMGAVGSVDKKTLSKFGPPSKAAGRGKGGRREEEDDDDDNSSDGDAQVVEDDESGSGDQSSDESEEESKEISNAQFNDIMDTLAAQPTVSRPSRFMTVPTMVWATYFPQPGLHNANLSMSAAWHSVQGRRTAQEDRVTVIPDMSALGDMLVRPYLYRNFCYFGVFDGHNGTTCASFLQHQLHLALARQSNFHTSIKEAMAAASVETDAEICVKLLRDEDYCGATGLFVVFDGRSNTLSVGNVGDSRCVLSRQGVAVELTKEHRPTRADERARIESGGGVVRNNRVNGILAVSRSFGDLEHKGLGPTEGKGVSSPASQTTGVIAVPEVTTEVVNPTCEFVVMASDGLWDVLSSQQVVNLIRTKLQEHRSLETAVRDVTAEAISAGSVDNVSVVVLAFHQKLKQEAGRQP